MAKLQQHAIPFSMTTISELAPHTTAFFSQDPELTPDLLGQFQFLNRSAKSVPFVTFSKPEIQEITQGAELLYSALVESLELLFNDYQHMIPRFYGVDFIRRYPEFVKYASHTYAQKHEAIYGRFDLAYDFSAGKLVCAYEFNGDTPVMLFESVQVQNWLSEVLGQPQQQFNRWRQGLMACDPKLFRHSNANIGIIGCKTAIEDALTLETIGKCLDDHNVYLFDISAFEFDSVRQRFSAHNIEFDYVFILMPWEEMVEASPEVIANWRNWTDKVQFMEPAWRWFIANKGGFAWLYWLLNYADEPNFQAKHRAVLQYLPRTQMSPVGMENYVSKPLMGRLSANISIYRNQQKIKFTSGPYEASDLVYQNYKPTGKIGKAHGIIGVWMAPDGSVPLSMKAATLCVRAHDDEVTDIGNERFLPHLIV